MKPIEGSTEKVNKIKWRRKNEVCLAVSIIKKEVLLRINPIYYNSFLVQTSNTITIYNFTIYKLTQGLIKTVKLDGLSNGRESTVNSALGGNTYPD